MLQIVEINDAEIGVHFYRKHPRGYMKNDKLLIIDTKDIKRKVPKPDPVGMSTTRCAWAFREYDDPAAPTPTAAPSQDQEVLEQVHNKDFS